MIKLRNPSVFRWLVLILGSLGYFNLQMTYLSVAPVLQVVARGLGIDTGAATILLISSFLAAGSLTWIFVGGYVCDRFGVLWTLLTGFVLLAIPASLTPWLGGRAAGVLGIRIVEGLATGFFYPTIPAIANALFPEEQRGLASGLMNSAVALGNSGGVFLGPLVVGLTGGDWKRMSALLSLAGWASLVFGVVLFALYGDRMPRHTDEAAGGKAEFRQAMRSKLTVLGVGTSFLAVWSLQGIFSLTSTFLAAGRPLGAGYGAMRAGQLTLGATLLAGVCGPVLNGVLLDKVFHGRAKWNLYFGFVLMSVCVYLLRFEAVTGNPLLLEADLVLAGLGPMFTFPTMYYLVACSYPPRMVGKMGGLWCGVGNVGGVIAIYLAGVMVRQNGSYRPTFALQAAMAALGLGMTSWLVSVRRREAEERASAGLATAGAAAD